MRCEILDAKQERNSRCVLIRSTLGEYLESLPIGYASYDVQRAIVKNPYLDRIIDTVLRKGHIPSITLISEVEDISKKECVLNDYKILDGLQRTHRLKIIKDTLDFLISNFEAQDFLLEEFKLKRKFRKELIELGSSGNILASLRDYHQVNGRDSLLDCFSKNSQWFEVWCDLTPQEEIKKMLLLNAGHKPVNIKHQLELLFNNILPLMAEVKGGGILIIKDKDKSAEHSNKTRIVGQYHFSHLISALLSFFEKKPVTTNSDLIEKIQGDEEMFASFVEFLSYDFLQSFIRTLYELDKSLEQKYNLDGVQWLGREVSLAAIFAAIGGNCEDPSQLLEKASLVINNVSNCNLAEYELARNSMNLAKVNIGSVNKRNIFKGFDAFIKNDGVKPIDWANIFSGDVR